MRKYKTDQYTYDAPAPAPRIREAGGLDAPTVSPARVLQENLGSRIAVDNGRWTPRKTLAFILSFNTIAWALIALGFVQVTK